MLRPPKRFNLRELQERDQFRTRLRHFQRDVPKEAIASSRTFIGTRGDNFQRFLFNMLVHRAQLTRKVATILTTEPQYLSRYEQAFTNESANPCSNYELLETKGDVAVNKSVVDYVSEAYPKYNCPHATRIFADIKSKFGSKTVLSSYASYLDFEPYITVKEIVKEASLDSLLEDVFEAFVGATGENIRELTGEIGAAYAIQYAFVKSLLEETEISFKYTDLVDAKTRLKELFQFLDNTSLEYTSPTEPVAETVITAMIKKPGQGWVSGQIAHARANNKKKSKEMASIEMANWLVKNAGTNVDRVQIRTVDKPVPESAAAVVHVTAIMGGERVLLGEAESFSKQHAETMAADRALQYLKIRNIFKPMPWEGDFNCPVC